MSNPHDETGQADTGVWHLIAAVLRQRRLMLLFSVGPALVAGVVSLATPRQYVARGSLVPQEPSVPQGALSQLATQFGVAVGRSATSSPAFYAELLQSKDLLGEILVTRYVIGGRHPFQGALLDYFDIEAATQDERVLLGIKRLRSAMTVTADTRVGIVRFTVSIDDRVLAASVAVRLLDLVNDYNLRRRQSQGRAEREFVEQRLSLAQGDLRVAEDSITEFLRHNASFSAPGLAAERERLQRRVALRQQVYVSLAQSLEAARIEEVRNTPVITVTENPAKLVEAMRRGTLRRMAIAVVAGALLGIAVIAGRDQLSRLPATQGPGFAEFVAAAGAFLRRRPRGDS